MSVAAFFIFFQSFPGEGCRGKGRAEEAEEDKRRELGRIGAKSFLVSDLEGLKFWGCVRHAFSLFRVGKNSTENDEVPDFFFTVRYVTSVAINLFIIIRDKLNKYDIRN